MADAKPWILTQISGNKRRITLSGWSAPFGRPRRSPLVEDGLELRHSETYYDGNVSSPTRHVFGYRFDDFTLTGRFMDKALGSGGTKAKISEIKAFLREAQPCTIEWGDVLAATGLLVKFTPSRESEAEAGWKLVFRIDSDDSSTFVGSNATPTNAKDAANQIQSLLTDGPLKLPSLPTSIQISTDLFESLDDLVGSIAAITGQVVDIANQISSLERAAFSTISLFRASIGQLSTALATYQQAINGFSDDMALARDSSTGNLGWATYRTSSDASTTAVLALLAELDRQSEIAMRGSASTTYTVQGGDTWEQASTRIYGSPSNAAKLRQANGAKYGKQPVPGRKILAPKDL